MWKLIKLTRLIRLIKIVKKKSLAHQATKALNMDGAMERLLFFLFGAFFVIHILSCLWVFFCQFAPESGSDDSFINDDFNSMSVPDKYLTSLYFIITTFSTVGYGDISASNSVEKVVCIIAMLVGVAAFSTGTSAITNLLTNYDLEN